MAKIQLLICSAPFQGHFSPTKAIAQDLIRRGYSTSFLTGSVHRKSVEDIGATFYPLSGDADFSESQIPARWPERASVAVGIERLVFDLDKMFLGAIPDQHDALQKAIGDISAKNTGCQIVVLYEIMFFGVLPTLRGALGPRPKAMIGIGIGPLALSSIDLPPFGPGFPPDRSPEGRERNKIMVKSVREGAMGALTIKYEAYLKRLMAQQGSPFFFDAQVLLADRFLQCCIPEFEHQRSDSPANLRFTGGYPRMPLEAWDEKPSWWDEIVGNGGKRYIIFVAQGTVAVDYEELVFPTMAALKDRDDILVIVSLCVKGATVPPGTLVPRNTRVHDWIPYGWVLPLCDLFVTNGGYGGFQSSVYHGVPLVVAGGTEDKPEIACRIECAGVGYNLRTGTPTAEEVRTAVDTVLLDSKYKTRSLELKEKMRSYDPVSIIEENITSLVEA